MAATAIAIIIVRPPSFEEVQIFRKPTVQIFWNHQSRLRGGGTTLAKPGEDLFVGAYGPSYRANARVAKESGQSTSMYTPHHAIQDAISTASHSRGITINMLKTLHELTRTYKRPVTPGLTPRQHLARDIVDLRGILREAGYDAVVIRTQLWELIRQNKQLYGL